MEPENLQKYILVPYDQMNMLLEKISSLEKTLKSRENTSTALSNYLTEKEAGQILNKRTTWFWNMRKSGRLPAKKAGNTWYYLKSDINKFIENGRSVDE
jgi:hypothetical protein